MSHAYDTYTFAANPDKVPQSFASKKAFDTFLAVALPAAQENKAQFLCTHGLTRGGWAIYTVKEVLESLSLPSLEFLTDGGYTYKFEQEYSLTTVAILDRSRQQSVISDMRQMMSWLAENPNVVTLAGGGCSSDAGVVEALKRDYISEDPAFDRNVAGDEGLGDDYLFVYLRSVLTVVENARANGLSAIHVLRI